MTNRGQNITKTGYNIAQKLKAVLYYILYFYTFVLGVCADDIQL